MSDPNFRGEASESEEDEKLIIGDQDETGHGTPDAEDEVMGGMGTDDEFGLQGGQFARGEIDLREQMERTTRIMDHATHRDRVEGALPQDNEGLIAEDAILDSLNNRKPGENERVHHPQRGHKTGAYTDIGEGRSGVTRTHKESDGEH
jgi:hypothetical protein